MLSPERRSKENNRIGNSVYLEELFELLGMQGNKSHKSEQRKSVEVKFLTKQNEENIILIDKYTRKGSKIHEKNRSNRNLLFQSELNNIKKIKCQICKSYINQNWKNSEMRQPGSRKNSM